MCSYEALTGDKPFPVTAEHIIAGHISSPPPRPSAVNPRVPASFDDVIARAMAKEPDDRYGSAGALGRAATAVTHATTAPRAAPTMPASEYVPPPPRHHPKVTGFLRASGAYSVSWNGSRSCGCSPSSRGTFVKIRSADCCCSGGGRVVVVVVAATIGVLGRRNSGPDNATQPTIGYSTPSSNSYDTGSPSVTSSRAVAPTYQDPLQQLRQIAEGDRSSVSAQLAEKWVPRLTPSSPGSPKKAASFGIAP